MTRSTLALAALGLLLIGIPQARGQQPAEEKLAIERIVLYKHGVGYFERGGVVEGDAIIPLAFKSREMKDVLKSLFAVDLDGGRIASILYRKEVAERRYRIRNRTGKAWTLYLDQRKSGGDFELTEPARAAEELTAAHRFKLELPARDVTRLTVREERQTGTSLQVSQLDTEQIALYLREPYLSEGAQRFLAEVGDLMQERAALARATAAARDELRRLGKDQERLRENMRVLRDSPKERTIREQYLERLLAADEAIESLNALLLQNAAAEQKLDARLAEKVRSFDE